MSRRHGDFLTCPSIRQTSGIYFAIGLVLIVVFSHRPEFSTSRPGGEFEGRPRTRAPEVVGASTYYSASSVYLTFWDHTGLPLLVFLGEGAGGCHHEHVEPGPEANPAEAPRRGGGRGRGRSNSRSTRFNSTACPPFAAGQPRHGRADAGALRSGSRAVAARFAAHWVFGIPTVGEALGPRAAPLTLSHSMWRRGRGGDLQPQPHERYVDGVEVGFSKRYATAHRVRVARVSEQRIWAERRAGPQRQPPRTLCMLDEITVLSAPRRPPGRRSTRREDAPSHMDEQVLQGRLLGDRTDCRALLRRRPRHRVPQGLRTWQRGLAHAASVR